MPKQIASQDMREVGENIRSRRKEIGMTQVQLASAAQLGENTIQRIESGQAQPTVESLFRIAKALGVTPNDLAPTYYEFTSTHNEFEELLTQFELLNESDKKSFLNSAHIFMAGLRARSASSIKYPT